MAEQAFTGIVEPRQFIAYVQRRVIAQASEMLDLAEVFRSLAQQLEDLADIQGNADAEALKTVAISLGTIGTRAALEATKPSSMGMTLAILSELRGLGSA